MQDELSSSSAPPPKRTSSPILIDLNSPSSGTGRKTRSFKRKAEDSASNEPKRQKKEKVKEKISKNKKQDDKPVPVVQPKKSKKNTTNGSVELEKKKALGDYTVDELLKLDGHH